jgi:predicted nucleic acid-binding protein
MSLNDIRGLFIFFAIDPASVVIMHEHGIDKIVSFDSDFDKVNGIKRIH